MQARLRLHSNRKQGRKLNKLTDMKRSELIALQSTHLEATQAAYAAEVQAIESLRAKFAASAAANAAYQATLMTRCDPPLTPVCAGSINDAGVLTVRWDALDDVTGIRVYRKPLWSSGSSDEEKLVTAGTEATFDGPFTEAQAVWVEAINEGGNAYSATVPAYLPGEEAPPVV